MPQKPHDIGDINEISNPAGKVQMVNSEIADVCNFNFTASYTARRDTKSHRPTMKLKTKKDKRIDVEN